MRQMNCVAAEATDAVMSARSVAVSKAAGFVAIVMVTAAGGCACCKPGEGESAIGGGDAGGAPTVAVDAAAVGRNARDARETTVQRESIFAPIDWPAPSEERSASGAPGRDYWQQQVDYVIEATLDTTNESIHGRATVTYTNNSPEELPYLWLHLEQNLFKSDSVGTLINDPGARFTNRENFHGGYAIESLTAGGEELNYHVYDTMARVDLPAAIEARGGRMSFDIAWSFEIPEYGVDRMGTEKVGQGTIYEIAQWFPAVAVYDDVHGWNTLAYLGAGEFYNNFGTYDVRLLVPSSHIVVATGVLQNPSEVLTATQMERLEQARNSAETVVIRTAEEVGDAGSRPAGDGPLTWHFKAEGVRTFAWASSEAFIWDAAGLGNTLVQSVYPAEAKEVWSKSTKMLRFAIQGYSAKWFGYPYPSATNVNGPVGGMEYPMIIFCGGRGSEDGLYGVTTHEIGHNWFPMTVNTDERRYAWMDEGFNTFVNHYSWKEWQEELEAEKAAEEAAAAVTGDGQGGEGGEKAAAAEATPSASEEDEIGTWPRDVAQRMRRGGGNPIVTWPDRMNLYQLGWLAYDKPAFGLWLLREQVLGPERFDAAFREYIREWAFKSPMPSDFFRAMENGAGADLAWFWRGWFYESANLDQAVVAVEQSAEEGESRVVVRFENLGRMVMPVVFRVTYDDDTTEIRRLPVESWFTGSKCESYWDPGARRVTEILVDPMKAMPDVQDSNNTWAAPAAEVSG